MADNIKNNQEEDFSEYLIHYFIKIKIKDVEIYPQNINVLQIREWVFDTLPRFELIITDQGILFDKFPLEESDEMQIELGVIKNEQSVINISFNCLDYEIIPFITGEQIGGSGVHITGLLKSTKLFAPNQNRSFKDMVSTDAIKQIAEECGFTTDIKLDMNDNMTWYQTHLNNNDMIHHLINKSFNKENDCTFCTVDRDGVMVFTTLQTAMEQEVKFDAVFDIKEASKLDETIDTDDGNDDNDDIIFYSSYKYINFGGTSNRSGGYGQVSHYYDGTESLKIENFSDIHSLTTGSNKLKSLVGTEAKHNNLGFESSNMHDNYMKAKSQNEYIKKEFFSSCMRITTRPDSKVKLFDKVNLTLPAQNGQFIDGTHSGEYLVGGIIHNVSNKGLYKTDVYLFRNGKNVNMGYEDKTDSQLS